MHPIQTSAMRLPSTPSYTSPVTDHVRNINKTKLDVDQQSVPHGSFSSLCNLFKEKAKHGKGLCGLTVKSKGWLFHLDLCGDFILSISSPAVQHGKTLLEWSSLCAPVTRLSEAPQRDEWHSSLLFPPSSQSHRGKFTVGSSPSLLGSNRDFSKSRGQLRCWNVLPFCFFFVLFFVLPPLSFLSYSLSIWSASEERHAACWLLEAGGVLAADSQAPTEVQSRIYNHHICSPLPLREPCEFSRNHLG